MVGFIYLALPCQVLGSVEDEWCLVLIHPSELSCTIILLTICRLWCHATTIIISHLKTYFMTILMLIGNVASLSEVDMDSSNRYVLFQYFPCSCRMHIRNLVIRSFDILIGLTKYTM